MGFSRTRQMSRRAPRITALTEHLESRVLLSAASGATYYRTFGDAMTTHRPSTAVVATADHIVRTTRNAGGTIEPMSSTAPTGHAPAQIRQAYNLSGLTFGSTAADGTGQTIAIVDAYNDPDVASDLRTFDATFGLSDPTLTVLNENGGTTLPGTDPSGPGNSWAMETALDVEWAHSIAPGANIVLVEANSASSNDLFAAINTARNYAGVSVVSMSWGISEYSGVTSLDSHFTTPAGHTPVTFVASSGDAGAYNGSGGIAVNYPAASPNVVGVGGTSLNIDSAGDYISETAWGNGTSSQSSGGSGGGLSNYESQPSYQNGVVTQSSTKRGVPDVSMLADPNTGVSIVDSYDAPSAPWIQIGGTSLAAPMWAALVAVADQGRALSGQATLSSAQTLADIYSSPASNFHDITSGSNGYNAGTGFDLVTGRGTPIASSIIPYFVNGGSGGTTITPTPTIGSFTVSPTSVTAGATVTLAASNVAESGGSISSVNFYRETNGTAGFQTTDALVGTGTVNGGTWTLNTSTSGFAAGSYTYYAVATDSTAHTSAASSATLAVTAVVMSTAPSNDNFANSATLTGSSGFITATNVGATREAGEPTIAGNRGGKSVWFTWTATTTRRVTLTTAGSSFDTLLGVFTGNSVSSLSLVASNDDASYFTTTSAVQFNAVAGTTYRFDIDGYNGASGSIQLNMS